MNEILEKKIKMPNHFSKEAADFCSQLLIKIPSERIGCRAGGVAEIKNHPWFADIDWEKLYMKQIPPPYVPGVSEADDVSKIDPEFLAEVPQETPAQNSALMAQFADET